MASETNIKRRKAKAVAPQMGVWEFVFGKRGQPVHFREYGVIIGVLLLSLVGTIINYSIMSFTHGGWSSLIKSVGFLAAGLIVMVGAAHIEYRAYVPIGVFFYLASLLLMAVVAVVGVEINGARRWLRIFGITFQPSELAKAALIMLIPAMIIYFNETLNKAKGIIYCGVVAAAPMLAAWWLTDNFSTAVIIGGIAFLIVAIARKPWKLQAILILIGIALFIAVVLYVIYQRKTAGISGQNFRLQRIDAWLYDDPSNDLSYQTQQSLYAVGAGGLFGRGIGKSLQKLGFIPEAQNDMVFAVLTEELGLVGVVLILILYAYILYRIMMVAYNSPNAFSSLVVYGVFFHIALQVVLNIAVVLRFLPNTGVTLPFISSGGTSTLIMMGELGLVLGVARRVRFGDQEAIDVGQQTGGLLKKQTQSTDRKTGQRG